MSRKSKVFLEKHIESMYDAKCTITGVTSSVNRNGQDVSTRTTLYSDKRCHVSSGSNKAAEDMELVRKSEPAKKIFLSSDLNIPVGCSFVVTADTGEVTQYKDSGKPSKYLCHQEIVVVQV